MKASELIERLQWHVNRGEDFEVRIPSAYNIYQGGVKCTGAQLNRSIVDNTPYIYLTQPGPNTKD